METTKLYDSKVWFKLKTSLGGNDYKLFVYQTMKNFLMWVDPNLHESSAKNLALNGGKNYWNGEGGIDNFRIKGEYIMHCKLYYYDENYADYLQRTIVFRNHFSPYDLKIVFLISDAVR